MAASVCNTVGTGLCPAGQRCLRGPAFAGAAGTRNVQLGGSVSPPGTRSAAMRFRSEISRSQNDRLPPQEATSTGLAVL